MLKGTSGCFDLHALSGVEGERVENLLISFPLTQKKMFSPNQGRTRQALYKNVDTVFLKSTDGRAQSSV